MPSILNKLKKRLQQEAEDAAQFTTKKRFGSFDLVKDIATRAGSSSYSLSKEFGSEALNAINAAGQTNKGALYAALGNPSFSDETDAYGGKFKLYQGAKIDWRNPGTYNPLNMPGKFKRNVEAVNESGYGSTSNNPAKFAQEYFFGKKNGKERGFRYIGNKTAQSGESPEGLDFALGMGLDPLSWAGAGLVGRASQKLGPAGVLLRGKYNPTGGLLEGFNSTKQLAVFTAAGAAGAEIASHTKNKYDDMFLPIVTSMAGGTAQGIRENAGFKKNMIDDNEFERRIGELRKQTMHEDPDIARAAEEAMAKLAEAKSKGMIQPSKKITRGPKLDELNDEEFLTTASPSRIREVSNAALDQKLIDSGHVDPHNLEPKTPEDQKLIDEIIAKHFDDEHAVWDAPDTFVNESLRRGSENVTLTPTKIHTGNGELMFEVQIDVNDLRGADQSGHGTNIYDAGTFLITAAELAKIAPKAQEQGFKNALNGKFNISADKTAKRLFRQYIIEENTWNDISENLGKYINDVETRRAAEGNQGFFGQYNSMFSAEDAKRYDDKMRQLKQDSMSADPTVAARAEAEMTKLGEQRSIQESTPTQKVTRGPKLDELSDEELASKNPSVLTDLDEDEFIKFANNKYPGLVKESGEGKGYPNKETLKDGSLTISDENYIKYQEAKKEWHENTKHLKTDPEEMSSWWKSEKAWGYERLRRAGKDIQAMIIPDHKTGKKLLFIGSKYAHTDSYGESFPLASIGWFDLDSPVGKIVFKEFFVNSGDLGDIKYKLRPMNAAQRDSFPRQVQMAFEDYEKNTPGWVGGENAKGLKDYLEEVKTRREAEGGQGFFGKYNSAVENTPKGPEYSRHISEGLKKNKEALEALDAGDKKKALRLFAESNASINRAMELIDKFQAGPNVKSVIDEPRRIFDHQKDKESLELPENTKVNSGSPNTEEPNGMRQVSNGDSGGSDVLDVSSITSKNKALNISVRASLDVYEGAVLDAEKSVTGFRKQLGKGLLPDNMIQDAIDSGLEDVAKAKSDLLEFQNKIASRIESKASDGSPNAEEPYFPTTRSERDVINQSMDEGRVPVGTEVEGRTRQALERSGMPYRDSSAATGGPVRTPYKITDVLRERYSKQSLADRDPIQNIPTSEMPTLRTHLQELIWGMDDASWQEEKAIRNAGGKKAVGEEARLKFKTNQFERPQAPPIGDYRLRAEELLQDLTDEDLNMPVANLEVADLIASIVGGRDMEDILVNRALEASAYRRSVTNQQATIPRDQAPPTGARSGMNATSNTIKFQQAVEPEAQFAAIEQIHNQITPGPPSPPTPGSPTISFLSDDEQAASLKYLADVKSLAKEADGVKTWTKDNVIIKAITPLMNLVNPSVLMNSAVGRLIVAKTRQELAVNELSSLPLAVLDKFNGRVGINAAIGKRGTVFQTLDNGLLKGFNKHWNDVFADVENLKSRMTPQQYEYAKTFNDIIDDIRTLREMHLLNNLPREIGGKLWVPRVVHKIGEIEIIKPTNHRAKRLWEEATEGAANGVNYADPRETLKLYLKDTYNDIIKQNFADEMQKITTPTTSLVNPKIRARVEASKSGMEVAKEDLKTAAKQWKADKTNPDTTRIYMEAKERAKEARIEQLKSNFAMEQALDSIKAQETNKSYRVLEDGTKEPIDTFDVTKLGERVVTREDAKLLRGHVGTRGVSLGSKEINESPLSKVLGSAGRVLRTTTSTLDTATPFIHTLPILTTRPNIWRKAMAGNYRALISPRYRDTYVTKNLKAINEMANHNIPVGSNEYFEAIGGEGDITRLLDKTLGESTARKAVRGTGRQTVGRFEAAMSTNLLIARTELWKANYEKYAAKNNLDGLAQYVRNMTGALDSRALMVGKGQRDQESFWLAFSPKLVRSTFALGAMALRPDTQEGFQAAKSLSAFVGATMTLAYLANLAFNPDLDPLSADALDPIDPTAGKKFLSAKTPIGYIGVGGQIRAAMQLLGKSGDALWRREPGVFLNNDQFDNPIMNWYVGRGAPGIQFGQDILEATTGANTNPYEDISSPSDFFKTEAQNFLPFFAQNIIEADDMKSGALSAGIGSFGPRFAPFSESERRDKRIQEMGFMRSDGQPAGTLDDLNMEQKNQYYEKWPVSKIDGEADNVTKMFNLIDDEEVSFNSDVALASLNVNRGKMSKVQFREFYTKRNAEKFAKIEQIRDTFNVMPADRSGFSGSVTEYINSKNTRPEDKAVSDYYAASSSVPLKDDGTVDFDGINAAKEKVLNSLDPAQRQYVTKMVTKASQKPVDELVTEYDIVKDITRPYFESDDRIFEYFRQSSGFFSQFQTYEAYQKFVEDTAAQSGLTADTMQGLLSSKVKDVKVFDQLRLEYKRLQRLQDPNLDRALTEWYGMEPANRYDYMLSGMGSNAGAALSPAIAANKSLNNGNNAAKFALANASNYKPVKRKYYRPQRSL